MDILMSKHYDGYEGEPEIQFIKISSGSERTILSIWVGFFDDIMCQFKPVNSEWKGLAHYYHLAIGWEDDIWEIPDVQLALNEFYSIKSSRFQFPETSKVLSSICDLLMSAINNNQKVWIDKD